MTTTATLTKTQDAQIASQYVPTLIDARKAGADFRLINVSPNVIRWNDGRQETVTARRLSSLQAQHPNWMADF